MEEPSRHYILRTKQKYSFQSVSNVEKEKLQNRSQSLSSFLFQVRITPRNVEALNQQLRSSRFSSVGKKDAETRRWGTAHLMHPRLALIRYVGI